MLDNALVYENAGIANNSAILANGIVRGYAHISLGVVKDDAQVYGGAIIVSTPGQPQATVAGSAQVFEFAKVESGGLVEARGMAYGNSVIRGLVTHLGQVYGNAVIENSGEVRGDTRVHGTAVITTPVYGGDIVE